MNKTNTKQGSKPHFLDNKVNVLFLILGGFFVSNAIIAELIGIKLFSVEGILGIPSFDWTILGVENLGLTMTAGVIIWPIVFIMTDIINEYFGIRGVRFLSFLTVGLIIYVFIAVFIAIIVVPDPWWQFESGNLGSREPVFDMQAAFERVFGQGLWIIAGSVIAFLVGQFLDVFVFHAIKKRTGEKLVWLRATGSTIFSQMVDSFLVLTIAFYIGGDWDLVRVLAIGSVNFMYKFIMAIVLTPFIYLGHYMIDRFLGEEVSQRLKRQAAL